MSQYNFHDASIQDALKKIEPDLTLRKKSLDNLSSDIQEMEKILKESVCPLGFELEYKKDFECDVLDKIPYENWDGEYKRTFVGCLKEFRSSICWQKDKSGSPRLVHRVTASEYEIFRKDEDPLNKFWRGKPKPFDSISEESIKVQTPCPRPLIEWDAFTRIQVVKLLPRFLFLLGEIFKNPNKLPLQNSIFESNDLWHEVWVKEYSKYHSSCKKEEIKIPEECPF